MKTYLKHRIFNVIDIKKLVALEYLDFEGKYKNYTEQHDFWEMCYVQKGNAILHKNGKDIHLSKGEIAFIPPNSIHAYKSSDGNESNVFVVCFECLSQALKTLGAAKCDVMDIAGCMDIIIDECTKTFFMNENEHLQVLPSPNFGGQQVIILQMEYLIIQLLRKMSAKKQQELIFLSEESFYADLTDAIIAYFQENIGKKLSLEEICDKANYSRSFVCKIFKKQTGDTLFNYFNHLKIEEAKRLLEKSDMSVTDIAGELGFAELKHFGAVFRKYVGVSPTTFRKNMKKER